MKNILFISLLFLFNLTPAQEATEPVPWTDVPLSENENTVRFAVMTDQTGGMREGVFAKYVDYVNHLQPDFVISVGDMVEGYTDLVGEYNRQWSEFDPVYSKFESRFYHVPGNHDLSNDVLRAEWKKKFGRTYYHFVFKNTLFLVVNTEYSDKDRIGDEQISYFENVLRENQSVRHTFLFMHNPLWDVNNEKRFKEIIDLMKDRDFTVFSGHRHHYYYSVKDGNEYYMLATTGGGSALRGPEMGEFDHIAWVSLKEDKPRVMILSEQGIIPKDIVNDETYPLVNTLRSGLCFSIRPIVHDSPEFNELSAVLEVRNPAGIDLNISGSFPPVNGLTFEPDNLSVILPPKEKQEVILKIKARDGGTIQQFEKDPVYLALNGMYTTSRDDTLSLPIRKKIIADYPHSCLTNKKPKIDGDLSDWTVPFYDIKLPVMIDQGWAWTGEDDGWYRFSVSHDKKNLYIAAETFDDVLLLEKGEMRKSQDKIIIGVAPGESPDNSRAIHFETAPCASGEKTLLNSNGNGQIKSVCIKKTNGFVCECTIPKSLLEGETAQGGSFVFNIAFMDQDRIENIDPSVLWWRPIWKTRSHFEGSGVYTFEDK